MTFEDHVGELISLVRPVPICWLFASILAIIFSQGGPLVGILASPVYGLAIAYPTLCAQTWRFVRPAIRGQGPPLLAAAMVLIPLTIVLLALAFHPLEILWVFLLGNVVSTGFFALIAKVVILLALIPLRSIAASFFPGDKSKNSN